MTEKTFHTVSWAPSAIKDAVEHATEAFKAADGAYARVSTFELSALIDATRTLIEHNEKAAAMPKVVCLSGSMRFEREMRAAAVDLSLEGHIVTGPFVNMKQPDPRWATDELADPIKVALDQLHFRKIDLADEVVVVSDETGYVGDSTRNEIAYAERHGKPVRYVQVALDAPESPQVSMEELRARIGAVVNDYTAGEDYGSGPTRYYLTVSTPDELTEHVAAGLFSGMEMLFRVVADWQSLWDEKEEWEKAAKEAWKRETVLSWLHAEAVWHAEHHRAQAEHLGAVAAEVERLKDVDAEAFGARFQVQSYDIVLGRIARVLTRLLADANISPLPKQLPHLAYRVEAEFQAVVRQRDEALTALEKQQVMLSGIALIPEDARSEIRDVISNPALRKLSRKMVGGQRETFASWGARAVLDLLASWGVRRATSELPPTLTNESAISPLWREGDIALDRTNFVHRRFEHGWRVVGRECGVQYNDESMETAVGPLLRLPSVPNEVDVVGAVPIEVAARLREEADRG